MNSTKGKAFRLDPLTWITASLNFSSKHILNKKKMNFVYLYIVHEQLQTEKINNEKN